MKSDVKLSIIIPTYHCSAFIEQCLDSVLSQMPPDCEVIAVDDGSGDDTKEVLQRYADRHESMKLILREHEGASAARNAGLDSAKGEFVTFLDCDDCMKSDFLPKALASTDQKTDLYIFGIEYFPMDAESERWTVENQVYESAACFAEAYVRVHHLLLYSNCNKFYRRSIIEKSHIRFQENLCFGEDRIFNYDYLEKCGRIVSSSEIMLAYIQRSRSSMSNRHLPDFYRTIMYLHHVKMRRILGLARHVSNAEKADYIMYDITNEINAAVQRFSACPDEFCENLPMINRDLFGGPFDENIPVDVIVIAGSSNCGYKVQKALEIGHKNPGARYLVSDGNRYRDGVRTEADFMADYLLEHGVKAGSVFLENKAANTYENVKFSREILQDIRKHDTGKKAVAVITGGFHLLRLLYIASHIVPFEGERLAGIPAYGPNTGPHNWYKNELGKSIIINEMKKLDLLRCSLELGMISKEQEEVLTMSAAVSFTRKTLH